MSIQPAGWSLPWAGIDRSPWSPQWWTNLWLAPMKLTQPILVGWTVTNNNNSSAPETEGEVVQRHSYGRQLGRMADALEALIQERDEGAWSDERYAEFLGMKQEIDAIKLDASATRVERLQADLAALRAARPAEYGRLREALLRELNDSG
jgi:hypothetical protein